MMLFDRPVAGLWQTTALGAQLYVAIYAYE